MILSDRGIRQAMHAGYISVDPMRFGRQIQPASLELHLEGDEPIELAPGEFRLASTLERVSLGARFVAQVNGKSSLGRLGLLVHATAGYIDPGFRGQVTLELKNLHHAEPIQLAPGQPICQLVFCALDQPPERLYGDPGLGSHYQNQVGPTPSYLHRRAAPAAFHFQLQMPLQRP